MIEWLLYIVTVPLFAGSFSGLERIVRSVLKRRKKGASLLQPFRDLVGLVKLKPIQDDKGFLYCAIGYAAFMAMAGCVLFTGGNFVVVILLMTFGNISYAGGFWLSGKEASTEKMRVLFEREGEKELLRAGASLLLFSMIALGFYLVVGFAAGRGGFKIDELLAVKQIQALFLPGLLAALLIYGSALRRKGYVDDRMIAGYTGKNLALLELGRWYESMIFFGIVFLFHFSGNAVTAVVGLFACALVEFLRVLLIPFVAGVNDRMIILAVSMAVFILCLINFVILL